MPRQHVIDSKKPAPTLPSAPDGGPIKPVPVDESKEKHWEKSFLAAFGVLPNIKVACEQAGVSRQHVLQWKRDCPRFAEDFHHAEENGLDNIEAHMMRRAMEKDTLAGIFILKNKRREVYGDKIQIDKRITKFTIDIGGAVDQKRIVTEDNDQKTLPGEVVRE
jgi:hypothetical protein